MCLAIFFSLAIRNFSFMEITIYSKQYITTFLRPLAVFGQHLRVGFCVDPVATCLPWIVARAVKF